MKSLMLTATIILTTMTVLILMISWAYFYRYAHMVDYEKIEYAPTIDNALEQSFPVYLFTVISNILEVFIKIALILIWMGGCIGIPTIIISFGMGYYQKRVLPRLERRDKTRTRMHILPESNRKDTLIALADELLQQEPELKHFYTEQKKAGHH